MTPTDKAAAHAHNNKHRLHEHGPRSGEIWTTKEEEELKQRFEANSTTKEIAWLHHRSELAIECRLIKLELIDENLKPIIQGATGMKLIDFNHGVHKDHKESHYEHKVKAILGYNPDEATGTDTKPFVVGVLGGKLNGFEMKMYNAINGKEQVEKLAKAQGVWIIDGNGNVFGGPEAKKEFKAMTESAYLTTFGKPSCKADGSLKYPYKLGNMVGRIPEYTMDMYQAKDLKDAIRCAEAAGVFFIDGYGQIHGKDKKQATVELTMNKNGELKPTMRDMDWVIIDEFNDAKPASRMGQMPTGSRKYLLL